MKKAYFITGTGTDVGKTFVTSCLLKSISRKKNKGAYWKWIQCGNDDVHWIKENLVNYNIEILEPTLTLNTPCSPHLAAKIESRDLIKEYAGNLPHFKSDYLFCEGAGGIMVPITDDLLLVDWIKTLKIPVIIVCDAGLGTINHTMLTIKTLKEKNIIIEGIIYNKFDKDNFIHQDNISTIEKLSNIKTLGTVALGLNEPVVIENLCL